MAGPKRQNQVGGTLCCIEQYPDHLRLIGLFVTDYSALEGRLALTMWALLDSPNLGTTVFYSIPSAKTKIDIVRTLVVQTVEAGAVQEEFLAAINDVRRVTDQRNRIVHGQWGIPAGPEGKIAPNPFVHLQYPMRVSDRWSKIYTCKELERLDEAIRAADGRLDRITQVLNAKRDPGSMAYQQELRRRFPKHDAYWKQFD